MSNVVAENILAEPRSEVTPWRYTPTASNQYQLYLQSLRYSHHNILKVNVSK